MKRILEAQATEEAEKRRCLAPHCTLAHLGISLNASTTQTLVSVVDAGDIDQVRDSRHRRGRRPILRSRANCEPITGVHHNGAHLAHATTFSKEYASFLLDGLAAVASTDCGNNTAPVAPSATESYARVLPDHVRDAQQLLYDRDAVRRWKHYQEVARSLGCDNHECACDEYAGNDKECDEFKLFSSWDTAQMHSRLREAEVIRPGARIIAITAKRHSSRVRSQCDKHFPTTVRMDDGTAQNKRELRQHMFVDQRKQRCYVLCYMVLPACNAGIGVQVRDVARGGRFPHKKIINLFLCARLCNAPIRISERLFVPDSIHYIPHLRDLLETCCPGAFDTIDAIYRWYFANRETLAQVRRAPDCAVESDGTSAKSSSSEQENT